MTTYPNRKTLYHEFINSDPKSWETIMGSYAVEGVDCPSTLYYLSLDNTLETSFVINETHDDRLAATSDHYWQEVLTIALPQRLLANTDLQGCWNQLFPRLLDRYKHETDYSRPIELYLYEVDLTNCVVIDNRTLVSENIVHNAFANNTHAVFGLPKLKLRERILAVNTIAYPDEKCTYYHPFNDSRYMQTLLSTPFDILNRVNA